MTVNASVLEPVLCWLVPSAAMCVCLAQVRKRSKDTRRVRLMWIVSGIVLTGLTLQLILRLSL